MPPTPASRSGRDHAPRRRAGERPPSTGLATGHANDRRTAGGEASPPAPRRAGRARDARTEGHVDPPPPGTPPSTTATADDPASKTRGDREADATAVTRRPSADAVSGWLAAGASTPSTTTGRHHDPPGARTDDATGDAAAPREATSARDDARAVETRRRRETAARARRRRTVEGIDARIVEAPRLDLLTVPDEGPDWDELARAHRRGPAATFAWQEAWAAVHACAPAHRRAAVARREGHAVGMLQMTIEHGPAPSGLRIARPVGAWPLGPAPDCPTGRTGAAGMLPVLLRHLATVDEVDAVQLGPLPEGHALLRAFDDLVADAHGRLPGGLLVHHDRVVGASTTLTASARRTPPDGAERRWRRLERERGPTTATPLDDPLRLLGVLRAIGGPAPEDDGGRAVERVLRRLFNADAVHAGDGDEATPPPSQAGPVELRGVVIEASDGALAAAACPIVGSRGGPLLVARRRGGAWDDYGLGHRAVERLLARCADEEIDLDLGAGRVPWKVSFGADPVPLRSVLLVRDAAESRARTALALSVRDLVDLVGSARWMPATEAIARHLPPVPESVHRSLRRWVL